MFNSVQKRDFTHTQSKDVGSSLHVRPKPVRGNNSSYDNDDSSDYRGVLPDCGERDLVTYNLIRVIRDYYINTRSGGKEEGTAYRKQCRTKRKAALKCILSQSDAPFSFRWSCEALGFDPDSFRNRILFDLEAVTSLVRDGVNIFAAREKTSGTRRKELMDAQAWNWEEAPERYKLSEKKGHVVIKMNHEAANSWLASLANSPMEFTVEEIPLTSANVVLILRHK